MRYHSQIFKAIGRIQKPVCSLFGYRANMALGQEVSYVSQWTANAAPKPRPCPLNAFRNQDCLDRCFQEIWLSRKSVATGPFFLGLDLRSVLLRWRRVFSTSQDLAGGKKEKGSNLLLTVQPLHMVESRANCIS